MNRIEISAGGEEGVRVRLNGQDVPGCSSIRFEASADEPLAKVTLTLLASTGQRASAAAPRTSDLPPLLGEGPE